MPQIKIKRGPFKNYTGDIYGIAFKEGVSVESLTTNQALQFSSSVAICDANTGEAISQVLRQRSMRKMSVKEAQSAVKKEVNENPAGGSTGEADPVDPANIIATDAATGAADDDQTKPDAVLPTAELSYDFTKESLEEIADKEGIAGIRKFAEPFGVKSKKISEIIDGLIAKKEAAESGVQ